MLGASYRDALDRRAWYITLRPKTRGDRLELRKRTSWVVIAAATAIFGTVNYISYRSQVGYIERFRDQNLQDIAADLSASLSGFARGAATYGELVATLPEARSALKDRDRGRLVHELGASYRIARSKYTAQQGTFFGADLKTFCRLMRPDIFGDDASHREMVVRAAKEKKTQSGLETSISSVSIRAVVPVNGPDAKLAGTFEWGFAMSRMFQRLKENAQADTVLLVDETTFTAPITSAGVLAKAAAAQTAEADRMVDGFRTVESTNVELFKLIVNHDLVATKSVLIRTQNVGDVQYGVLAVPIADFSGHPIGAIVIAKSMAGPQQAIRATRLTFLAATIAGLILLAGAVQLVFNGFLIRPIIEIGELGEAMIANPAIKIDLKNRSDEIGTMARNLDFLRDKLVKEKDEADRQARITDRIAKLEAKEKS
jgi:methyl-accepting chemotaxis protein